MAQPYNYSLNVPSPMQAFGQAFNVGAAGQKAKEAREARELALQRQEEGNRLVNEYFETPADQRTYDQALRIGMYNPQFAELAQKQFDALSEQQQQSAFTDATQIHSALLNVLAGKTDFEILDQILDRRVQATKGNPGLNKMWSDARELARTDPDAAELMVASRIATLPGGKEYFDTMKARGEEARAEEERPFKLRAATADSLLKEANLSVALLEMAYKPDQLAFDLDLSEQQVNQAKAAIAASRAAEKKSGAEAARAQANADAIAQGIIPLEKRPEIESKMRKEYTDNTKDFVKVRDAYGRMLAVGSPETLADEGPADLALIFNYMKMLDPGSTVREGEFANAENAGGAWSKVGVQYNKLLGGARLTPQVRASFLKSAKGLYDAAEGGEKVVRSGLERIAKGYGLNTENIFFEIGAAEPPRGPMPAEDVETQVFKANVPGGTLTFQDEQTFLEFKRNQGR
jgi:hypothetical protein